jgi:SAM-dependent methyltransferase
MVAMRDQDGVGGTDRAGLLGALRGYWDADADTYDRASGHAPRSAAVLAAWRGELARRLPPAPARVLDVGAGTGFLSLLVASLGHQVTALDLSPGMLGRLRQRAEAAGLAVETVVGPADEPPTGFDAVVERHVLWTLPDPEATLAAWCRAAEGGTLVAIESVWGAADPVERRRGQVRSWYDRVLRRPPDHHAEYDPAVRQALPLGSGTPPAAVVAAVERAGWRAPRVERLWDVAWAERLELPPIERALGVPARFCVVASAPAAVSRPEPPPRG